MSQTFKDLATVKGYSPKMGSGRPASKQAGHKERFDGTVRSTRQGREETFLNGSAHPMPSRAKSAVKYGK